MNIPNIRGVGIEVGDGYLRITLDDGARGDMQAMPGATLEEALQFHVDQGWIEFIRPEYVGALTSSPILCLDCMYPDHAPGPIPHPEASVYWYPSYQIRDPLDVALETGHVDFPEANT